MTIDKSRPRGKKPPLPAFTPVPRHCQRHDGWTPERQRGFTLRQAQGCRGCATPAHPEPVEGAPTRFAADGRVTARRSSIGDPKEAARLSRYKKQWRKEWDEERARDEAAEAAGRTAWNEEGGATIIDQPGDEADDQAGDEWDGANVTRRIELSDFTEDKDQDQ